MRGTKVDTTCIFSELQATGRFLALNAGSTLTDPLPAEESTITCKPSLSVMKAYPLFGQRLLVDSN